MRGYRIIGGIGRALIAGGVLTLLFVAYQLWGTGLQEAQAQTALQEEFQRALPDPTVAPEEPTTPEDPAEEAVRPHVPTGDAVANIRIPRIGVDKMVVEGVGIEDLKRGPGRYPDTPMPGEQGNAAIAGHRTTYGSPFFDLDALEPGDEILVATRDGEFRYRVRETLIVRPDQVEVIAPTEDARLTLTTCHPRFSARERLVVVADLEGEATPPRPVAAPAPAEAAIDAEESASGQVIGGDGPAGDPEARVPALTWGALCALVWAGTWALARRWRTIPAYAIGVPVFAVALFLFFENLARLFPASV
jgi:sortase A